MAIKFLDILSKVYKQDVSRIESILKEKNEKTQSIIKSAFEGEYVSKDIAIDRIQTEFLDEKVSPANIDKKFLKENMDFIISKVKKMNEGDIKIIINNDVAKGKNGANPFSIDVEEEGATKKKPGRPSKAPTAEPMTGKDATTEEPTEINEELPPSPGQNVKVGNMIMVNGKDYVVDQIDGDTLFVSDEDGTEAKFNKDQVDMVRECDKIKKEDTVEVEIDEPTTDDEDDEENTECPCKKDDENSETSEEEEEEVEEGKIPERRPLKWADIEKAIGEDTCEESTSIAEMIIQKRPLTWNDIEREIFKKNSTENIKNDKGEEVMKSDGLTSKIDDPAAYSADKKIKDEKPKEKADSKGPSSNNLTSKPGIKNSYAGDKKIKNVEAKKEPNLSGKKDAGAKKLTSMPGKKSSYGTDKEIKPIAKAKK